jgi:hypothetical protein
MGYEPIRFRRATASNAVAAPSNLATHPLRCRQLASLDTGEDRSEQIGGGAELSLRHRLILATKSARTRRAA